MSISELKDKLKDVPGIEHLTMQHLTGRDCYGFAGHLIAVDPMTPSGEIEIAIRNAAKLPIVSINSVRNTDKSMTITGLQPGSIRDKLDEMKRLRAQRRAESFAKLAAADAKHDEVDHQIEIMASKLDKEADDALQEFATFTNGGE